VILTRIINTLLVIVAIELAGILFMLAAPMTWRPW